jgi:hypothetical protein
MDLASQKEAQSTLKRFKAKEELSLVFFELAMSFRNGYGTTKNVISAIYYLKVNDDSPLFNFRLRSSLEIQKQRLS